MKAVRLYLVPSLLVLSSLFLFKSGMNLKKESVIAAGKLEIKKAETQAAVVKPTDLITIKQLIDALALKSTLPVAVVIDKNHLKISPIPSLDPKVKTKDAILAKYPQMMDFITQVSALPYKMEYTSFCIGEECESGFDMQLTVL